MDSHFRVEPLPSHISRATLSCCFLAGPLEINVQWYAVERNFSEQRFSLGIDPLPMLLSESALFTVAGLA